MLQTWLSSVPYEYIIVEFAQCCPSKNVYSNFILSLLFIFLRTSMNRYQNQLSICFRVKNKLSQYSNFPCELNVWTMIARFMGPMWGPFGADRTQVGPMLAPWALLSGIFIVDSWLLPNLLRSLNSFWIMLSLNKNRFKVIEGYTKFGKKHVTTVVAHGDISSSSI